MVSSNNLELPLFNPNPPSFCLRGLYSMNTSPTFAVHRSRYSRVPRLFPSTFQAAQVLPPLLSRQGESSNNYSTLQCEISNSQEIPSNQIRSYTRDKRLPRSSYPKKELMPTNDRNINKTKGGTCSSYESWTEAQTWENSKTDFLSIPFYTASTTMQDKDLEIPSPSSKHILSEFKSTSSAPSQVECGTLLSKIADDEQNSFVFAPTGLLSSLTVARINVQFAAADEPLHFLKATATVKHAPDFLLSDMSKIYDLTTSSFSGCDKGTTLLATTCNGISVAVIRDSEICWKEQFSIQRVTSSAYNPLCFDEFSIVCEEGLFTGSAETLCNAMSNENTDHYFVDLQPVSLRSSFRTQQIEYGSHPRTLLLSQQKGIVQRDLRQNHKETLGHSILNLSGNGLSSKSNNVMGPFHPLKRTSSFLIILATSTALMYIDTRMPGTPLLEWSLSLPSTVDTMAVLDIATPAQSSDIIALSSTKHEYLEVFHAHTEHVTPVSQSPLFDLEKHFEANVPLPRIQWSDLPLSNMDKLMFNEKIGISLIESQNSKFSLVQFSPLNGMKAQLLEQQVFEDGEKGFEFGADSSATTYDNSVNVKSFQKNIIRSGKMRHPFLTDFKISISLPGFLLLNSTQKMFWKDAIDLRERICSNEDDEMETLSSVCIPRPYLKNILAVSFLRATYTHIKNVEDITMDLQVESDVQAKSKKENHCAERNSCHSSKSNHSDENQECALDELFTGGFTLSEVGRLVRSGMPHCVTPAKIDELKESFLQSSNHLFLTNVWHSNCLDLHDEYTWHVDSSDTIPTWVDFSTVLTPVASHQSITDEYEISKESEYARLVERMKTFFEN